MTTRTLLPAILQAVMKGQPVALGDRHYPRWHLAPVTGLMNDPNGFIHFQGRYHLFYQWNPLGCSHQHKCWGHWSSADLTHWQHEPLALMPDEEYDRSGCYSGSAVDDNGRLTLCYTGNVKFDDGTRTAWQCLAVQNADGGFDKLGPVMPLPGGYTGHVRDPKVWRHGDNWYMVLGAQDLELQGKVLLLRSDTLWNWENLGEIAGSTLGGLGEAGYMWECPDLFMLDGKAILITCPQGVTREEKRYLNTYPSAYLCGDLNYDTPEFRHGPLMELDAGFEFYAPQTTLADDGRRLLIGWMGVPDGEEMLQPTVAQGWIHQMTCPRELSLRDGLLCQQPVRELSALRGEERRLEGVAATLSPLAAESLELMLEAQGDVTLDFAATLRLEWTREGLRLARRSLASGEWLYRYWQGDARRLHILCDRSSVEIFINDGEGVMSSRYFPAANATLGFEGDAHLRLRYWSLRACMVE
ncbi:sucrose-6-phosphate hydrolase [Cronobacter sakazakii]|uniref:sucrose-6-phosphate hydrolase n=2 Tax=Cronobacter sakazakii TaxID=28141 RepID=UPI000CF04EFA|nr:sucrose-6-phosphate hydrolase [Cronobacter sakazakii]EIX1504944.1 sucrose-6-phosphate hydrolase [Cronobacter sakazakii]EIX1527164.1 sucrose-6-phosphate hydrolase [Cronobacter sakazakii]EIX1534028.1 sucrose-6-phosphate hydrolase [Cronobacter sakazakii]EIX1623808.1 sucrose-6-phosphate hydrolase [Cronobacter sakazakii]EIX1664893.1 sucrose-6-phosphate hydrolase [Cronobacter sakazakii]